jgi:hypothetical protein
VAMAPHGSPGASSARAAQRWNDRIAANRCATVLRACPSVSRATYARRSARGGRRQSTPRSASQSR